MKKVMALFAPISAIAAIVVTPAFSQAAETDVHQHDADGPATASHQAPKRSKSSAPAVNQKHGMTGSASRHPEGNMMAAQGCNYPCEDQKM